MIDNLYVISYSKRAHRLLIEMFVLERDIRHSVSPHNEHFADSKITVRISQNELITLKWRDLYVIFFLVKIDLKHRFLMTWKTSYDKYRERVLLFAQNRS